MKRAAKRPVAWVALVVLVMGTATVFAQRDSSDDRTNRERADRAMATGVTLRPDPDTDEVAEVLLGVDGTRRGFWVKRQIDVADGPTDRSFFWAIDTRNGTYRVFRLTDPRADAVRISEHLRRFGSPVTTAQIERRLELSHQQREIRKQQADRMRQSIPQRRASAEASADGHGTRRGGPLAGEPEAAAAQQEECWGSILTAIQAWELGAYFGAMWLTETHAATYFVRHADGFWVSFPFGGCWANGQTFVYTSWMVTYCGQSISGGDGWFDNNRWGEYVNHDFGWDGWGTSVWQQAAVAYSSGFFSNTLTQWVGGEGSWLITSEEYYSAYTNCS